MKEKKAVARGRRKAISGEELLTSALPKDGAEKPLTSRKDIRDARTENVEVNAPCVASAAAWQRSRECIRPRRCIRRAPMESTGANSHRERQPLLKQRPAAR